MCIISLFGQGVEAGAPKRVPSMGWTCVRLHLLTREVWQLQDYPFSMFYLQSLHPPKIIYSRGAGKGKRREEGAAFPPHFFAGTPFEALLISFFFFLNWIFLCPPTSIVFIESKNRFVCFSAWAVFLEKRKKKYTEEMECELQRARKGGERKRERWRKSRRQKERGGV